MDTLRLHSVLYAFRDFLPDLPPKVLLRLLDPHFQHMPQPNPGQLPSAVHSPLANDPDRGRECDHDLHVLRAYYCIRAITEILLSKQPPEEWSVTLPIYNRYVAEKTQFSQDVAAMHNQPEQSEDVIAELEARHLRLMDLEAQLGMSDSEEVTLLQAAQTYVLTMRKTEFQVTTLEKVFCLLFLQSSDVMGVADAQSASESARPALLVDAAKLRSLLLWLKDTIERVQADILIQNRFNPNPKLMSKYARLGALKLHVEEGWYRLGVLSSMGLAPTMDMMVAPLETISAVFLKLDGSAEAKVGKRKAKHAARQSALAETEMGGGTAAALALPAAGANPLQTPTSLSGDKAVQQAMSTQLQVSTAEKWLDVCELVRERIRKQQDNILEVVVEFVTNHYKDPRTAIPKGASPLETSAAVMQGFFFAMDVAVTFCHAISTKTYESIMDFAINFLMATRPSHDTQESLDLYNFYLAYAKHCRANNRNRFKISSAFDVLSLQRRPTYDAENKEEYVSKASNDLLQWVQAFRVNAASKKAATGSKPDLTAGWLTSTTDKPEDRIAARSYTPYLSNYEEYCKTLGVDAISDNVRDEAQPIPDGAARASPWNSTAVLDYLVGEAAAAAAVERKDQEKYTQRMQQIAQGFQPEPTADERLERISQKMACLGRKLLPSLGALRYALRHAPGSQFTKIARLAREQSAFLPAYAKWIDWRLSVFEKAMLIAPKDEHGSAFLPDDIRDLLSLEDSAHDHIAFLRLLRSLLSQQHTLSVADKKTALSLADTMTITSPETQAEGDSLIQSLLVSIIDDQGHLDDGLRMQCIMRLKDPQWAAQMCLKYVDSWDECENALPVCLKCLSDLKPAHPLRSTIAFKYNLMLLFKQLRADFPETQARDLLEKRQRQNKPLPAEDAKAILRMFQTWLGFENECKRDLARVLMTLLEAKQVCPLAYSVVFGLLRSLLLVSRRSQPLKSSTNSTGSRDYKQGTNRFRCPSMRVWRKR